MRIFAAILLVASGLVVASPAVAAADERATQAWASCIWERLPTSAANWIGLPRLRRTGRWAEDSPGYRLQFRLMAACHAAMTPAGAAYPPGVEAFELQRAMIATRPNHIGPDLVDPLAHRCDLFFEDDPGMARVAGVDWGYGPDLAAHQLSRTRTIFGEQITPADIAALLSETGGEPETTAQRLLSVAPTPVSNHAEGEAGGTPFVLADEAGLRRCRLIRPDGSLTDPVSAVSAATG